jgi:hypothetical protein
MTVEIQVQGTKVTITVGGRPFSVASEGGIAKEGTVGGSGAAESTTSGGSGATESTTSGGNGPGYSGSALVIGPIVIGGCAPQPPNGQSSGTGGGGATEGTASGGSGPVEPTASGGGGADTGMPSGVLVIGPIVVGGCVSGSGPVPKAGDRPSQAINVGLDEE